MNEVSKMGSYNLFSDFANFFGKILKFFFVVRYALLKETKKGAFAGSFPSISS